MKKNIIGIIVISTIIVITFFVTKGEETILIGYSSGTTGMLSEFGVDGRNAFLLKVKEVNENGGINGKLIDTLILDDKNDPNEISVVHNKFKEKEVNFIVGHIISALDEALLEEAKDKTKLILSASISSAKMDGIDDQFIRLTSSYAGQVKHISNYMYDIDNIKSLTVVYDLRNKAYTEGFYNMLREVYDGEIIGYSIADQEDLSETVIDKIKDNPTEGILMLTPANVTAILCQLIDINEMKLAKYSVSWSMTNDLFEDGGKSVDGMKLVYVKPTDEYTDDYEDFRQRFINEYDYEPSSICFNTYEATTVLIEALINTKSLDVGKIKNEIIGNTYKGLLGDIVVDNYGDRQQPFIMFEVKDGQFIPLE